jgi:hypothetical protein
VVPMVDGCGCCCGRYGLPPCKMDMFIGNESKTEVKT